MLFRSAERYGIKVFVVSGQLVAIPQSPLIECAIVGDKFDAADDWIAERAHPRSIVVTADIPLAQRALAAGATVIGNTGKPFTKDSIGMAMASRELMSLLRAMGERHLLPTERGRIAVGWLIVEDLAMVLALVLLPAIPALTAVEATLAEGAGAATGSSLTGVEIGRAHV